MTNRLTTLIQRSSALVLAATVTLAIIGGLDRLATQDIAADALLARHAVATHAG